MSTTPATTYTAAELHARLQQITDDPTWPAWLRLDAKWAATPVAAEAGCAITPVDLSDTAIRDALTAATKARGVAVTP